MSGTREQAYAWHQSGNLAGAEKLYRQLLAAGQRAASASLQVTPSKVQVKQKAEIVVWVTDGLALKVEFKKTNPFPDLTCPGGQFCGALLPTNAAPGLYDYKVTVDGVVLDPNVEVVK